MTHGDVFGIDMKVLSQLQAVRCKYQPLMEFTLTENVNSLKSAFNNAVAKVASFFSPNLNVAYVVA